LPLTPEQLARQQIDVQLVACGWVVPAYVRLLFCCDIGPFRWMALFGDPEDILKADAEKEARRGATIALTLVAKLAAQKQTRALECQRNQSQRTLFEAQDRVDAQRDEMVGKIEGRGQRSVSMASLLLLRWRLARTGAEMAPSGEETSTS